MSTPLQMPKLPTTAQRPSLAPSTVQEALDFSIYLSKSELIPKDYQNKPHNILVAIQYGMELGLPPMQALQGIALINGRPAMWGDAVLAVVIAHPAYEWHTEVVEGEGEQRVGVFTIKRRGQEPHVARFSVGDARKAGLWGKTGPWTQHADRMLKLRARGFALRDKFPDALKGIISREEAEDYPVTEARSSVVKESQPLPAPTPILAVEPTPENQLTITRDQAREFTKAWRAAGYSVDDAKAWLMETLGLSSSLSIPADQFAVAMAWANTPKAELPRMSSDEKRCYALFDQLHYGLAERAEALLTADGDWEGLLEFLRSQWDSQPAETEPEKDWRKPVASVDIAGQVQSTGTTA